MPRISEKMRRLKAAAIARQARHPKQSAAKAVKVETESSTFSNLEIKQEPTESPPSTSQILHRSAAVKVLKLKKKKEIKVEVHSELSPSNFSNFGYRLAQKKREKDEIRKAAAAKRVKHLQEAKAAKALQNVIQQNDEGEEEEEAADHQTTVALPVTPNHLTALEEINFYRQVPSTDYFNGYGSNGNDSALLIVYQPNDKTFAREYYRMNQSWTCSGCRTFNKKVCIRINNKEVFAPLKHYCQPRMIEEILQEQTEYQNLSIFGNPCNLERDAAFYSSSAKFDKFDSTEYKFGLNSIKRINSRLIVSKKNNPEYVYHYHKHAKKWVCSGCFKITRSTDEFGEFVNRDLYLPKKHFCKPLTAEESEEEQQILATTSASVEKQIEKLFKEQKKNLRRLFFSDLEFGISKAGKSMLIICEPLSGRQLVREFVIKSEGIWQCIRCVQKKKSDTYVIKIRGLFYTSKEHECKPLEYFDSMCKQMAYLNPGLKRARIQSFAAQKGDKMPFSTKNRIIRTPKTAAELKQNKTSAKTSKKRVAKTPRLLNQSAAENCVVKEPKPKRKRIPIKIAPFNMYYPSQNVQQNGFTNNYSAFPGIFCYQIAPPVSLPPFDFGSGNNSTTHYSNLPSSSFTTLSNTKSSKVEVTSSSFTKNETQTKSENLIQSEMDELPVKSVESVSSALLKFIDSIKSSREELSPKTDEPSFCF